MFSVNSVGDWAILKYIYLFLKQINWLHKLVINSMRIYGLLLYRVSILVHKWKVSYRWAHRGEGSKHDLPAHLIVSLTSYPSRYHTLPLSLKCLLTQTVAPDRVILWIAHDDKLQLSKEILSLERAGLEILYCDDLKSYKKITPTLKIAPGAFIVTADDDLYYRAAWLEELVSAYSGDSREVVCHRAHRVRFEDTGMPRPYSKWMTKIKNIDASTLNFPTSGAGVLYPPHVFHTDVDNDDLYMTLCPRADDIWLYWMMRLNGAVARKVGVRRKLLVWPGTQLTSLWQENGVNSGNDVQIMSMIKKYGFPIDTSEYSNDPFDKF
jgi:protein O-GlcNAc transferase